MESNQCFASVIILNWHAEQFLPACFAALESQTFQDFEVILLHNGLEGVTSSISEPQFPQSRLSILNSATNLGFAAGNNLAARQAQGEYLVLLNADAFPEPDWLEKVHQACLEHPKHFFASRLVKANEPQTLDGEWNVYHASGLAWRKNHAQALSKGTTEPKEVLSACAAAGAYPREAFESVGGFDEDFFAYMEDIDLDFRMQLLGYKCLYLPQAVVQHVGSGSTSARSGFQLYHGHRNLVWTFVKNMPGFLFWLLLPVHILINLLYLLLGLFIPSGKEIWHGKRDALKGLGKAFAKRRQIQASRKVSVWHIAKLLDWNPLSPLVKSKF
ncbi:MAG TPA: glycosyltransferase family 2 protein [Anaerolineaceae bacterium]|nr:glycosyltransferase family 2 protein [Anaerolineaceae bacterium]